MSNKQPAPVLAWHREAAKEWVKDEGWPVLDEKLARVIAAHDPAAAQNAETAFSVAAKVIAWQKCEDDLTALKIQHAETVRLMEAMLNVAENCDETGYADGVGFVDTDKLHDEIRAHLAKLKGTK